MRRRPAHEVLLFPPRGGEATKIVRCRSLVAARAISKALLRPHARTTTRALYHEDARRLWTTTIVKPVASELPRRRYEGHEAERIIVPSCGELGWCP